MKAEIDYRGWLTISPDNETEEYALTQWWKNFRNTDESSRLYLYQAPIHLTKDNPARIFPPHHIDTEE